MGLCASGENERPHLNHKPVAANKKDWAKKEAEKIQPELKEANINFQNFDKRTKEMLEEAEETAKNGLQKQAEAAKETETAKEVFEIRIDPPSNATATKPMLKENQLAAADIEKVENERESKQEVEKEAKKNFVVADAVASLVDKVVEEGRLKKEAEEKAEKEKSEEEAVEEAKRAAEEAIEAKAIEITQKKALELEARLVENQSTIAKSLEDYLVESSTTKQDPDGIKYAERLHRGSSVADLVATHKDYIEEHTAKAETTDFEKARKKVIERTPAKIN
ncbi:hypothetical protein AAMO2058_001296100 [Amorphochlora amoebiformis]